MELDGVSSVVSSTSFHVIRFHVINVNESLMHLLKNSIAPFLR